MTPVLLIGYGNLLRRDDGIGRVVAERFVTRSDVRVLTCHQLTPELTDELMRSERAVFVDATLGGAAAVRLVSPTENPASLGHVGDPAWLLGLSKAVYGRCPEAWLVTVPVEDVGFGEGLSVDGERMVEVAVRLIEQLIRSWEP